MSARISLALQQAEKDDAAKIKSCKKWRTNARLHKQLANDTASAEQTARPSTDLKSTPGGLSSTRAERGNLPAAQQTPLPLLREPL